MSLVEGRLREGRRGAMGTILDSGGGIIPRSWSRLFVHIILLKKGAGGVVGREAGST